MGRWSAPGYLAVDDGGADDGDGNHAVDDDCDGTETWPDEYLNSAYMEAGLDYNILGVDWRPMEGPAKTQV